METKCFCRGNNLFPLLKTLLSDPDYGHKWYIYSYLSKVITYAYVAKSTNYVGLDFWF